MSDRNDPKKGDLILSGNRSLAIRRLDLVKRGLELVQELKKRQLDVVIGDHGGVGGAFSELFSAYIQKVIENKYDLKVRSFFYGEELLEQVENGAVDILILIINNIRFRHDDPPWRAYTSFTSTPRQNKNNISRASNSLIRFNRSLFSKTG